MSSCKDSTHIRHNQITLINKSSPGRGRGRGRGKEGQGEGGFAALKSCHAVHGKKLIKVFAHNNNNNNIRLNEIFISQWTEGRSQGTGRDGVSVSGMEYDYDFTYVTGSSSVFSWVIVCV